MRHALKGRTEVKMFPGRAQRARFVVLTGTLLAGVVLWGSHRTRATEATDQPEIISVRKIWDRAPHSAFTDLIRFQNRWYCIFREAESHGGSIGKLRVLTSRDGGKWESAALLVEEGIDLRDPKLSIMPDGRLMMVAGGTVYDGTVYQTRAPRVAFSRDGREWDTPSAGAGGRPLVVAGDVAQRPRLQRLETQRRKQTEARILVFKYRWSSLAVDHGA